MLFGIAPKLEADGYYSPSKLALKLGTVQETDFEDIFYQEYKEKRSKILAIFTEQKNMTMKDGKMFLLETIRLKQVRYLIQMCYTFN